MRMDKTIMLDTLHLEQLSLGHRRASAELC
jgi:hypothetical protein